MLDGTGGLYLSHRRELYGHFQNGPVSRSPDGDKNGEMKTLNCDLFNNLCNIPRFSQIHVFIVRSAYY